MRIPIFPAAMMLFVGGLLYAAYNINRQVLVATDERPKLDFATAMELAASLKIGAVRYWEQLGRWPQSPADVNLDEKWLDAHRGIASLGYGSGGTVHVHLRAATDGPATWIVWTPRRHGERTLWDCEANHPRIAQILPGCATADDATLARSERVDVAVAADSIEVAGLSARCQALGKVGYTAARARSDGQTVEDFVRSPIVAFVDDDKQRADLEAAARWVYASAPHTPGATQRLVLDEYRCAAS